MEESGVISESSEGEGDKENLSVLNKDVPEFIEFCNHVRLGQWELACAIARGLLCYSSSTRQPYLKDQIVSTLKSIVAYPEQSCISFTEIPSPANLSWQCCLLLEEICGAQDEDIIYLKKDAEFRMMLQDTLPDVPVESLQEMYDAFANATCASPKNWSSNSCFTEECVNILRRKLLETPLPVHCLLLYMMSNIDSSSSKTLMEQIIQIYLQCLWHLASQLPNETMTESKMTETSDKLLLFLSIVPDIMEDDINKFTLWDDLVHHLLQLTRTDVIETKQVYGALLARKSLNFIRYYCDKEDIEYCRNETSGSISSSGTMFFETHAADSEGNLNFREVFLCTIKQKTHFLESFLNEAIHCLHEGKEQIAWELLKIPLLRELHPFVLILALKLALTDENAENVMLAIESWIPNISPKDPGLKTLVCKLKYYMHITKWCTEKLQLSNNGARDLDLKHKARNIFTRLQSESVLSVVHGIIGHHRISEKDMLLLLSNKIIDPEEFPQSEFMSSLELASLQSTMIYRGCLAIQYVMDAIKCSYDLEAQYFKDESQELILVEFSAQQLSPPDRVWTSETKNKNVKSRNEFESKYKDCVSKKLDQSKFLLDQIYPLKFRVEILENIFSLLFVTSADLQNSGTLLSEMDDYEGDCTVVEASSPEMPLNLQVFNTDCTKYNLDLVHFNHSLRDVNELSSSSSESSTNLTGSAGDFTTSLEEKNNVKGKCSRKSSTTSFPHKTNRTKSTRNRHSSLSAPGSESGKCGVVPKFEFMCSKCVVQELLECLKAATVSTNLVYGRVTGYISDMESPTRKEIHLPSEKMTEVENEVSFRKLISSSVRDENVKTRLSQLLKNINDAQWRLEVITDKPSSARASDSVANKESVLLDSNLENSLIYEKEDSLVKAFSTNVTEKQLIKQMSSNSAHSREICHLRTIQQANPGIIPQMLASPDALLRYLLMQGKIDEASQVKKLFNLQDTPDVQELAFVSTISSTVNSLKELTQFKRQHPSSVMNSMESFEQKPESKYTLSVSLEMAAVAEAAAAGKEVTKVGALIGNLFSTTQIAPIPEVDQLLDSSQMVMKYPFLPEFKNIKPPVLADLAYTSDLDISLSGMLLEMALQQASAEDLQKESKDRTLAGQRRNSMANLKGIFKTILQIRQLIQEIKLLQDVQADSKHEYLVMHPAFSTQKSLANILSLSEDPLEAMSFKDYVFGWQKLITSLTELRQLLHSSPDSLQSENKSTLKTLATLESRNPIHSEFLKLRRVCLDELKFSLASFTGSYEGPQYMKALFRHVQRVCKALLHCRTQCAATAAPRIIYTSYFSVLEDNPSEVLATLILKEGVPPISLEEFATEMKVNLLNVVIEASCPFIPCSPCLTSVASTTEFQSVQEQVLSQNIVLNYSNLTWELPRHPVIVVQELLSDLLHLMKKAVSIKSTNGNIFDIESALLLAKDQEWIEWITNCSELAHIDLTLLSDNVEKIVFFGNLGNIMMIHAFMWEIVNGNEVTKQAEQHCKLASTILKQDKSSWLHLLSPYFCEQLVYMKLIGYHIGQLKFLSLYDLKYIMLRYGRSLPPRILDSPMKYLSEINSRNLNKFAPNPDPRLHFTQTNGCPNSPRIQVLYVEDFVSQLESSTTEFLMNHVKADVETYTIILPELLALFSEDFVVEDSSFLKLNAFEGLVRLVASNISGQLQEEIIEILDNSNTDESVDSSEGDNNKKGESFTVQFSSYPKTFGVVLEYDDIPDQADNLAMLSSDPNSLEKEVHFTPEVVNYLKSKSWILVDFLKLLNVVTVPNEETNTDETSELISDSDPVYRLISWLMKWKQDFYDDDNSDDTISNSEWIVPMLSPSFRTKIFWHVFDLCIANKLYFPAVELIDYILVNSSKPYHNEYILLRECFLCHLAAGNVFSWTFALRIEDLQLKVNCILSNLATWPDDVCMKVLRACISECALMKLPNMVKKLKKKLKEIDICQKILEAKNKRTTSLGEIFDFESWRDVVEESINSPYRILYLLKRTKQLQLSREWAELYPIPADCDILVKEMHLLSLLEQEPLNVQEISDVLFSVTDSTKCVHLCNNLITQTKNFASKLLLLDHLKNHCFVLLSEIIPDYEKLELGLKMMLCVPESVRDFYEDLILYPEIVFEQLLMNMEIKAAGQIVKTVLSSENSQQSTKFLTVGMVDALIEKYARKSVEFPWIPDAAESLSSSIECVSLPSVEPNSMPPMVPKKEDWIPDAKVSCCMVCNVENFSMFCRRHHCRRCGRVVCGTCSEYTLVLEEYGTIPVRACRDCYLQTQNRRLSEVSSPMVSASPDRRMKYQQRFSISSPSPQGIREKTAEGRSSRSSTISADKLSLFYCCLTTDGSQNENIIKDFYYEQAPSVSLCLSLLQLHSDSIKAANCMLDFCDVLMKSMKPKASGKPNMEIDYGLVISMMKTLLLNAKMKLEEKEDSKGVSRIDVYLNHLDLINILVTSNCRHLIPVGDLRKVETVRKMRDKLLDEERFVLALEISTKCGLDTSHVYQKWGMISLQTGCWKMAREKFAYCMQRSKDMKQAKTENPLLGEILQCLQNSRCTGGLKATDIHHRVSNLKNIQFGVTQVHFKRDDLDPFVLMECLYYLKTYGSAFSIVAFYQRHKMLTEALQFIISEGCVPEVFVESLLLPCLESGQLSNLLSQIRRLDPALAQWKFYLISSCRYLHRHKFRHILYRIQVFMEDYLRAAISVIHFFTAGANSYKELNNRLQHLSSAISHYDDYLKQYGSLSKSMLDTILKQAIMIQSNEEVERHKNTALLQITVTKTLNKPCAAKALPLLQWGSGESSSVDAEKKESGPFVLPTLFENNSQKTKLAAVVALSENSIVEGMPLTNKIIRVCGLDAADVYCMIGKMLVHSKRKEEISQLLTFLQNHELVGSSVHDDIASSCIRAILHQQGKAEEVEYLVRMMHSDTSKINGYLLCGKLRAAYLLAMQIGSIDDVKKVMATAEKMGQEAVRRICEKWLQNESKSRQN